MSKELELMFAHPGRWAVTGPRFQAGDRYTMVEVTPEGEVYQLTHKMERDGPPLDKEGWNPYAKVYHVNEDHTMFTRIQIHLGLAKPGDPEPNPAASMDKLVQSLADELIATPDEQILAGEDPSAVRARARAMLDKAQRDADDKS